MAGRCRIRLCTRCQACRPVASMVALAVLPLALGPSQAQATDEGIRWRSPVAEGRVSGFDAGGAGPTLQALAGGPGDRRHVVVQLDRAIRHSQRAALDAAGVRLLRYLGANSYFAALDRDNLDLSAPSLANVSAAYAVEPTWKLHPQLADGIVPEWAVIPIQIVPGRPIVAAYILFHADVRLAEAERLVDSWGGLVRSRLRSVNGLVVEAPFATLIALAEADAVEWIEPALPPLDAVNDSNRILTQADVVQDAPYGLTGAGVAVLVYDIGTGDPTHSDFGGRLTPRDDSPQAFHSTHVAGTIGGDGTASGGLYRGMAPGVVIESYGYQSDQSGTLFYTNPGDLERDYDEAINVFGVDLANNSIGSNICVNGLDCELTGDYGVTAQLIDAIVGGALGDPLCVITAAGNERGCLRCRALGPHTAEGYRSTAPPATAKNHITVGAVNSNDDSITVFTSWGPTDDGRLKPDVCAPGCQTSDDFGVTSPSFGQGADAYLARCGTSMAAPTVTGLAALLLEDYREAFPNRPGLRNSALKALLAHNARDIEQPGPDYRSGYGSVRVADTVDFMRTGNFLDQQVDQGDTAFFLVRVEPGTAELKLTLAWDDVPATPNVAVTLVNDLDLRVFDPASAQYFPWTLNSQSPGAAAVRDGPDHRNNLEQVDVDAPAPGLWRVEVYGYNVPDGPQVFSLCGLPRLAPDCDLDNTPDDEQISAAPELDCTGNGTLDACEPDCDADGTADSCEIQAGTATDCNVNRVPDVCEPWTDCDTNGVFDPCDVQAGADDCDGDWVPDECEPDCNTNGIADDCDLGSLTATDCNGNTVPDVCDLADGTSFDCNTNQAPDECDLARLSSGDCNANAVPDECDVAGGVLADCDANGMPDECRAAFAAAVNLSELDGRRGFALLGAGEAALLGQAVASAGDLNADGFDDLVIGAPTGQVDGADALGKVYVVFGAPDVGDGGLFELANPDGVTSLVINGADDGGRFGGAAACAGDVNADGIDDLIIGAYRASTPDRYRAGRSYVVFGAPDLGIGGVLRVADLDGANGFVINGARLGDQSGISVSSAGDVNADGVDDLLLGAWLAGSAEAASSGEAYVVFGGIALGQNGVLDLADLDQSSGLVISGARRDSWLGYRVAAGGDLNADGVDDVAVSAIGAGSRARRRAGFVAVLFGGTSMGVGGTLDLAELDGGNGFRVLGDRSNDALGTAVAAAGDLNADGVADLILGAPNVDPDGRRSAGASYVLFGGPNVGLGGLVPVSALEGHNGFALNGIGDADAAGNGVCGAADVNGDGLADIIIGALGGDSGTDYQAGEGYVVYGHRRIGASGAVDLAALHGTDGFLIRGVKTGDFTGWSVASAGDVNGDGLDDVLLGAPFARRRGAAFAGAAYVVFGRRDSPDCDGNGVPDTCDLAGGRLTDLLPVGGDGVPDECQTDCNTNEVPDLTEILAGAERDCNHNGLPDACDLGSGASTDALPPGGDGILDECQSDCNTNGIPDAADLRTDTSADCNLNIIPDECDIVTGNAADCNSNRVPDNCDLAGLVSQDCNSNELPDECDIALGASGDCNANLIPDECEPDCNQNSQPDDCDLADGTSSDIDHNGVPDECHNILRVPATHATIQAALDHAGPGDTVLLADGVHAGNQSLNFRGRAVLLSSENGPQGCIVEGLGDGGLAPVFLFKGDEPPEAQIRGLTITNGRYVDGGGIYVDSGAPTISHCIIRGNEALVYGGAVYCDQATAPVFNHCTIEDNTAGYGGGGVASGDTSTVSLQNCVIRGNTAPDGGAIAFLLSDPVVDGCTIVGNVGSARGGAVYCAGSEVAIRNTILWANTAPAGGEIALDAEATLSVSYSVIAGGAAAVDIDGGSTLNWAVGNLQADPMFKADGLHLRLRSPCRNAGDPEAVIEAARTDLDRQPRVQEGRLDIGADEVAIDWGTPSHRHSSNRPGAPAR